MYPDLRSYKNISKLSLAMWFIVVSNHFKILILSKKLRNVVTSCWGGIVANCP